MQRAPRFDIAKTAFLGDATGAVRCQQLRQRRFQGIALGMQVRRLALHVKMAIAVLNGYFFDVSAFASARSARASFRRCRRSFFPSFGLISIQTRAHDQAPLTTIEWTVTIMIIILMSRRPRPDILVDINRGDDDRMRGGVHEAAIISVDCRVATPNNPQFAHARYVLIAVSRSKCKFFLCGIFFVAYLTVELHCFLMTLAAP